MKRPNMFRMRLFSFVIPALMDGMIQIVQVPLPLLALRFGASPWFLGMLGWPAQSVRLPVCLLSGAISERVGRMQVMAPAMCMGIAACLGLAAARNNTQVFLLNFLFVVSLGAFYPAFQAFLGERSPKGELRKNLSAFNIGWTVGGTTCGLIAGYVFTIQQALPFIIGAILIGFAAFFVVTWSRCQSPIADLQTGQNEATAAAGPGPLLGVARASHFLGFFAYGAVRLLFPKLARSLGMSEGAIGVMIGVLLAGQGVGILISSIGPWWRGKLWPLLAAQGVTLLSALVVATVSSGGLFAVAFLFQGMGLGIAYSSALYYGLQGRSNMGGNTGIHESLVAGGHVFGSLTAGAAAQFVSLRAPYLATAIMSLLLMTASLVYWARCGGKR